MKIVVRFFLCLVHVVTGMALQVVSYMLGPFLWFLIGCLVWSIWRQDWLDVGLLSGVLGSCVVLMFVITFFTVIGKEVYS